MCQHSSSLVLKKQTYVGAYPFLILSEYFTFPHSVLPGTDLCQQPTKKNLLEMKKKLLSGGISLSAALLDYDPCQRLSLLPADIYMGNLLVLLLLPLVSGPQLSFEEYPFKPTVCIKLARKSSTTAIKMFLI